RDALPARAELDRGMRIEAHDAVGERHRADFVRRMTCGQCDFGVRRRPDPVLSRREPHLADEGEPSLLRRETCGARLPIERDLAFELRWRDAERIAGGHGRSPTSDLAAKGEPRYPTGRWPDTPERRFRKSSASNPARASAFSTHR